MKDERCDNEKGKEEDLNNEAAKNDMLSGFLV